MRPSHSKSEIYHIEVHTPGPMKIRLKMREVAPTVACLIGYDRSTLGEIGEIEASGKAEVGHVLVAVNDIVLLNKTFDDILDIIKSQPMASKEAPRKLSFCSLEYLRKFKEQYPNRPLNECYDLDKDDSYSNHLKYVHESIRDNCLLDNSRIRNFAKKGLPDGNGGIRSIVWKILLGYLPLDTSTWEAYLEKQRKLYLTLLEEMTITPSQLNISIIASAVGENAVDTQLSSEYSVAGKFQSVQDHPLHVDKNESNWAKFWSDSLLLESIEKDVIRTYPDMKFFLEGDGAHQKSLQNILFLFAKLNPAIEYVQGMNELVGTLFYVFANDQNLTEWANHAEADTFFCFSLLMGEIRDMYMHNMDNTSFGITGRIQRFIDVLKEYDSDLSDLLLAQGIEPSFYSLRWITTLLSREFDVLDTIRLWDSLLADTDRDEFLCYICTTMVLEQKEALMRGDFGENLSLLQSYPPMDVTYLLRKMEALREHHSGNDSSHSPYPLSGDSHRNPSPPAWALLQTLQKGQDAGSLNSSDLLVAGMSDVWRASNSLSKLVSSAGSTIKTAVFKTADKYGVARPFTAFDGTTEEEDWAELCAAGEAFDLGSATHPPVAEGRGGFDDEKDLPIDFGSVSSDDDSSNT